MAEQHPIPVPNNAQLEHLTQLRVRAVERARRRQWIDRTYSRAIHCAHTAMTALDACLMLVAVKQKLMRTRRDLLTELSAEEQNDEQFEALLWNKVC